MVISDNDPIDWDVDEIVAFLCDPVSAPWAASANSLRPNLVELEQALRENFINGEVLLYHVDKDSLKDDLQIKALGHRSSVLRAVDWLRAKSAKYRMSMDKSQEADNIFFHEPTRSPSHRTAATASLEPPSRVSAQSPQVTAPSTKGSKPIQRVAPIQINSIPRHGSSNEAHPRQANSAIFVTEDKSSELTSQENAFYDRLLQKYQVEDDQPLPGYGESGSEGEFDAVTWEEILEENPMLKDPYLVHNPLPLEERKSVLSRYIEEQNQKWRINYLPREAPYARELWLQTRDQAVLEAYNRDCSDHLRNLEGRLKKLKEAIISVEHRSKIPFQKACGSLDTTLNQIFHERWKLSVMALALCPRSVSHPPKAPRPRKEPPDDDDDDDDDDAEEESLGSDTETASEQSLTTDSDVRSGDDSSEEFLTEKVKSQPWLAVFQSSSSDDSETDLHSNKRRRVLDSEKQDVAKSRRHTHGHGPFMDLEDVDVDTIESLDTNSNLPSEAPEPSSHRAVELSIETPPLNPTQTDIRDSDVPDDMLVKTPPLNPTHLMRVRQAMPKLNLSQCSATRNNKSHSPPPQNHGINTPAPADDDIELFDRMGNMSWKEIETSKNGMHLLAKLLMTLKSHEIKEYRVFLHDMVEPEYRNIVEEALYAMVSNDRSLQDRDKDESALIMRLAAMFMSWYHCIQLKPAGVGSGLLERTIDAIEDEGMFLKFFRRLKRLHLAYEVWYTAQGFPSDDDEEDGTHSSPSGDISSMNKPQKRKKKGKGSKIKTSGARPLSNMQREAQERQARQERARDRLLRERELQGLSTSDPDGQAVTFKEPVIYLHPHLGKFVKPHQLAGIQFMWRELIEANNQQGCLLAHVMGLGKTFQVIALLATIAACAASNNPQIRAQVPEKFHRPQFLILCPSSVVQNWTDEFVLWLPEGHHLGPIREIISRGKQLEMNGRIDTIKAWNEEGGILIMSYEMLRILILNKSTKIGTCLDPLEHTMIQDCLLSGPNIIVADEAHKLKGERSAISQVASRFKSTSRIALTGSPLANHLSEYFQMVEWVARGYLEDLTTFKRKFVEPIQAGSYIDSTMMQQRESLKSLQLLNGILQPKVLRADTSVIASDLPSKTEFVLVVPLTGLQKEAYNLFVESTLSGSADISTKLWSWLAILQLCCNHPYPFREKLFDRLKIPEDSDGQSVLPQSIQDAGLPRDLFSKMEELFNQFPNLKMASLSNRILLLDEILDRSIRSGDKVLIFTQSLPTMDYLDFFLRKGTRKYRRIDGSMLGPNRQIATKNFNTNSDEEILLISTRAGGVGLNMFGANRVIIFDFLFNPMWEEQAIGRAYRLGQKKPVYVYRFIAGGTFEELIFNQAKFKRELAVRVVDKKTVVRQSTRNTHTKYLFPVKDVEKDQDCDVLGKDPKVLDRILARDGNEIVLRATLSHIQDNENDRLTEEESRLVEDELKCERLKRSNRRAYDAEMTRRHLADQVRFQQEMAQNKMKWGFQRMPQGPTLIQNQSNFPQDYQISHAGDDQSAGVPALYADSYDASPMGGSTSQMSSGYETPNFDQSQPQSQSYHPSSTSLLRDIFPEMSASDSTYYAPSSTSVSQKPRHIPSDLPSLEPNSIDATYVNLVDEVSDPILHTPGMPQTASMMPCTSSTAAVAPSQTTQPQTGLDGTDDVEYSGQGTLMLKGQESSAQLPPDKLPKGISHKQTTSTANISQDKPDGSDSQKPIDNSQANILIPSVENTQVSDPVPVCQAGPGTGQNKSSDPSIENMQVSGPIPASPTDLIELLRTPSSVAMDISDGD
ncbi:hypothetical protein N7462_003515 [Penicillium macrosclerotiorum]|uniref:uncharacterized protein n=1 Tax=Penicillium macrosclerotiorum TaxID=303699 RepID=UPI0025475ED4|nr:uncharacterized protein N7462_003515 [Penicillium macrosclerotiorum]KAJ5689123.1 hypothetical protein N7462_003515 [Penicillium macrosclerotiorum]